MKSAMTSLTILFAVVSIMMLSTSCGATVKVAILADGSAGLSVEAGIPQAVAAKMASFREGADADTAPLFNPTTVRKAAAARGIVVVAAATPAKESFSGSFSAKDLSDIVAKDKALAASGLLTVTKDADGGSLSFRLDRGNAKHLPALFPGIDPYVLEALSPPAVEDAPITAAEYRSMLKSLFGSKAMPSIEASRVTVTVTVPVAIVKSSGGTATDKVFTASIDVIEALVLEKPVEFSVAWKR